MANIISSTSVRCQCRVSFRDVEGIEHSVEVTAESLFEAAALGLHALNQAGFATGPGSGAE